MYLLVYGTCYCLKINVLEKKKKLKKKNRIENKNPSLPPWIENHKAEISDKHIFLRMACTWAELFFENYSLL